MLNNALAPPIAAKLVTFEPMDRFININFLDRLESNTKNFNSLEIYLVSLKLMFLYKK